MNVYQNKNHIRLLPVEVFVTNKYRTICRHSRYHSAQAPPFAIAATHGLGLYNDMTGDFDATQTWLDWIANGGEYSQTGETLALSPAPDNWQAAPIGGEQTLSISNEEFYSSKLDRTLELLRTSHTTFIGPGGAYDIPSGGPLQTGIDSVQATIGYHFYVEQVKMPRQVHWGKKLSVQLVFNNNGIAPMYYEWPVNIFFIGEDGSILLQDRLELNVRRLLPVKVLLVKHIFFLDKFGDGNYFLGVCVRIQHQ